MFLRFTKTFSSVFISSLAQAGLSMATRSSRSSPTESSKPLFQTGYFKYGRARIRQNKKELVAKKTFTPWEKAKIKAAAKDEMSDFYFLNKVLHLIAYELLCHHPYYESFTFRSSCSFWKASPMIIFEEALNHLLSVVPWMLMTSCARQVRTNWIQCLYPNQIRRTQLLQNKTQCMLLISWHWCESWRQFQNPLKILHLS